jgi:hypothetical protein
MRAAPGLFYTGYMTDFCRLYAGRKTMDKKAMGALRVPVSVIACTENRNEEMARKME